MTERLTETYPCNKCKVEFCSRLCYRMTRWAEIAKEKLAEYETTEEDGNYWYSRVRLEIPFGLLLIRSMCLMILTFTKMHTMKYMNRMFQVLLYTKIVINTEYMQKKQDNLSRHILESVILENQSFLTEKKQRVH